MLTGEAHGFRASNGVHEDSNTVLRIVHDAANSKLKAKLLRDGRDVTNECVASAFVWTKGGSAAGTGKEIAVTDAEVNGDVQFSCTYTETQGVYGTVSVNNSLVASHDPATADANHEFSLLNGMLKVEIPNSAGNGTDYRLADGVLSVNPGFTGTLTAEYEFSTSPTREIDFEYDHNGLRTQKKVVENGITTIYDYTLHGKLITHLTKRTVKENGDETTQGLHFFYDAQSKPAFVEFEGEKHCYIYNLQGDVVGIVDATGNSVVEYKYDINGMCSVDGAVEENALSYLNPFRYRHYMYDEETGLYYLTTRYYSHCMSRFISSDILLGNVGGIVEHNVYVYCKNNKVVCSDTSGMTCFILVPDLEKQISMMDMEYIAIDSETLPEDVFDGCAALTTWNDMGDWSYRIEEAGTPYEHIHLRDHKNNKEYDQYLSNGNDRHKNNKNNKKGPSGKLKDKVKEKIGWDWDGNKKKNKQTSSSKKIDNSALGVIVFIIDLARQCLPLVGLVFI